VPETAPSRAQPYPRALTWALLSLWLAGIAVLTLLPSTSGPQADTTDFLCIGCGSRGTADVLLNLLVFLPLGGLMATVLRGWRVVFIAACLTVGIETLQTGIPGRDPALQDLLTNTGGALAGVLLVTRGIGGWGRHALAALAVVAWLAPVGLLIPMASEWDLYGQWTPVLDEMEPYRGAVQGASLGGRPVRHGALRDAPDVRTAIAERHALELSIDVGPDPSSFAIVFQIVDIRRRYLVTVGALGDDLILRGRNPAQALKLDQPDVRWRGAMRDVAPDETVILRMERGRGSVCMSVDDRRRCRLAPSLAGGWGHLAKLEAAPAWLSALVSLAWPLALGVLLGATSSGYRSAAIRGATLAAVGLAVSLWSPDVRPDVPGALLLAAATLLGAHLRSPLRHAWLRLRPPRGVDAGPAHGAGSG
jgi:hypothetical protein